MHQFYIHDIQNIEFSKSQKHQIKNVLRMRENDLVRVVDVNGQGAVVSLRDDEAQNVEVVEPITFKEKKRKLKIIASLIRNERLEWMIQKAAETGVDELVLYKADHGVVKSYGSKETRKLERFNTIALEASEQAMRQFPLLITEIIDKNELASHLGTCNLVADTLEHKHFLDVIEDAGDVCVITGPEGGFSDEERKLFASLHIQSVTLGDTILRAETAPLAISILFSAVHGRGK